MVKNKTHLEREPLSHANFEAQFEDIQTTINQARQNRRPLREAYAEANQAYIKEETNPDLRAFSELILTSPRMASIQKEMETMSMILDERGRNPELIAKIQERKPLLIAYNDQLRNLIYENPGCFKANEITSWFGQASRDEKWAGSVVRGIGAEVAVRRFFDRVPGVTTRFSSEQEERRGIDLAASKAGKEMLIDVKSGGQQLEKGLVSLGGNTFEFGVDRSEVRDFQLVPAFQKDLDVQISSRLS